MSNENNGAAVLVDAKPAKANKPASKASKPAVWDMNAGSMTYGIRLTLARNPALMDGSRNADAVIAACRAAGITSPDATIATIAADLRATVRALRAAGRMPAAGEGKAKKAN